MAAAAIESLEERDARLKKTWMEAADRHLTKTEEELAQERRRRQLGPWVTEEVMALCRMHKAMVEEAKQQHCDWRAGWPGPVREAVDAAAKR